MIIWWNIYLQKSFLYLMMLTKPHSPAVPGCNIWHKCHFTCLLYILFISLLCQWAEDIISSVEKCTRFIQLLYAYEAITTHTICRLFNEERPVSHTIHCNALQKEEPKAQAEADNSRGGKISMVTDVEYSPASTPEDYAT